MRRVLLIAFHFPPCAVSSGLQRTLSFTRYLSRGNEWEPLVLSASSGAYPRTSQDQLGDIPGEVRVLRGPAIDIVKTVSIRGRYPRFLALPDRWNSWYFSAVPMGLSLIRKHRPDVIWSTYPIATAHSIAATLARRSGIPWVADFRDPMVERSEQTGNWYPEEQDLRRRRLKIEEAAVRHAARLVFVSPSAARLVTTRYPQTETKCAIIPNGFDSEIFAAVQAERQPGETGRREPLTLVHSGTLYPGTTRDATPFLHGLAHYLKDGAGPREGLRIRLRATGFDRYYAGTIEKLGLDKIVELLPPKSYREAIAEMLSADGLLLFQGAGSNTAIPGKLYEYLGARRPILAFVDETGDTAAVLRSLPVAMVGPIDDPGGVAPALDTFVRKVTGGEIRPLSTSELEPYSREAGARMLSDLLSDILSPA